MAPVTRRTTAAAAAAAVAPADDQSASSIPGSVDTSVSSDPAFEHVLFLIGCGSKTENPDHPIRRCLLQNDVTRFRDL